MPLKLLSRFRNFFARTRVITKRSWTACPRQPSSAASVGRTGEQRAQARRSALRCRERTRCRCGRDKRVKDVKRNMMTKKYCETTQRRMRKKVIPPTGCPHRPKIDKKAKRFQTAGQQRSHVYAQFCASFSGELLHSLCLLFNYRIAASRAPQIPCFPAGRPPARPRVLPDGPDQGPRPPATHQALPLARPRDSF